MASLTLAVAISLVGPGAAVAAGCEVLTDPRDRAECVAREAAREAARGEVERRVARDGATSISDGTPTAGRTAAWQQALDEAGGVHPGDVLEPRPLAAIVGLAWFGFVLRHRLRQRRRRTA